MVKKTFIHLLAALTLALGSMPLMAEDIDIFSQNTSVPSDAPNVLIIMDNRASTDSSWGSSTRFESVKTALATVVSALKTQFRIGILTFTESGSPNNNVKGGYVRFAIQDMTTMVGDVPTATAARNCLLKMVGNGNTCSLSQPWYTNLTVADDKGDGAMSSLAMSEAYLYFAGANAYSGHLKVKADPAAFLSNSYEGPTYKTPISTACQKNFIIFINNGDINDSTATATQSLSLMPADGDKSVINPPNTANNNVAIDEWSRYLNKVDTVKAVSYALEVGPSTNGQGPATTALLQSMGRQGKGGYFSAINSSDLLDKLTRIFNDINAQNSVFASTSLPLSADNSGAFLNQVYIGVFRPDAQGRPRWMGNLKQYQFAATYDDTNGDGVFGNTGDLLTELFLVDRAGVRAANPGTGFARPDTLSYWTALDSNSTYTTTPPTTPYTTTPDSATTYTSNPGTGGFWFFDNKGSGGAYDAPDGEWIEKGGAAQKLREAYLGYGNGPSGARGSVGTSSATGRKVLTCLDTCLATASPTASTPVSVPLVTTAASSTTFDQSNTEINDALLGTAAASVSSLSIAAAKSITGLSAGTAVTISSISKTGGVGTANTSSAHGLVVGDTVVIAGAGNAFNGTYTVVTAPTTMQFTFTASNGNSSGTAGTATKAETIATATSTAHGFQVGERVTVAGATPATFNGVFAVTTVTANTFTYELASKVGVVATGTIAATSNKVYATTAAANTFATGDSVTIVGATPIGYVGVFVITVTDATHFTYSYPTAAVAGSASGTITASVGGGRVTLINWIRGVDTQDENGDTRTSDVRASIHGDVLHSRPIIVNYGAAANTDNVYLFYGGNDGVFRAIKGGQTATDGVEQWAFIPKEFLGKFRRLYENSPQVLYTSTPVGVVPTPLPRDYFWDGSVANYIERNSSGTVTKAYLYIMVRRGGRFIYALDVTSPTAPKFLWKKGCTSMTDNTTCDSGFEELGGTWSQPNVASIKANTNPVLIFGAGYDPAEDSEPPPAADGKGRGLFVVDAFTGVRKWFAGNNSIATPDKVVSGLNFSLSADVLPIDRNQDGYIDRVYAADVGGGIWRFDIGDSSTSNWTVSKIAALADRSVSESVSGTAYYAARKFLFGMDVVIGDQFDSILIGSGDREHPLATNRASYVKNRFYMVKDPNTGATGADLGVVDRCVSTVSTDPTTGCTNLFDATGSAAVPADAKGWFVSLATGEQVINSPTVVAAKVFFGTNQPDYNNVACTANLGIARRYSINYLTGAGDLYTDANGASVRYQVADGGGFLPSPVSGVVEIGGNKIPFVTDNPLNPGGVISPTINPSKKRFRLYWRQRIE
jgi:type IV pilus assembly protein PilY1